MNKAKQQVDFITKRNMLIFILGIITIAVAFILMAQPPVNGFLSRTLAPVILVVAYLVIIPFAIMAKDKKETEKSGD